MIVASIDADNFFAVNPTFTVAPEQLAAFQRTRTGVLITESLAQRVHWKVGDQVPVHALNAAKKDGSSDWTFDVVGTFDIPGSPVREQSLILMNYPYFDTARATDEGTVQTHQEVIADASQATAIGNAIDQLFTNSAYRTYTETEKGIARDAAGRPIVDAEVLAQVQVAQRGAGLPINVALRGVGGEQSQLRAEIHLIAGRMFRPGLHELVVGRSAEAHYPALGIGKHLTFQNGDWVVVGIFASNGPDLLDSEIFTDAQTLLSAYQRNWFQSVAVRLAGPTALAQLQHALAEDPTLHVNAYLETAFRAAQSRRFYTILKVIGYCVGGMMATGALFGAVNSLYAAVSTRSLEIATLRAIGFGSGSVVVSVLVEALLPSVAGAVLGAVQWTRVEHDH